MKTLSQRTTVLSALLAIIMIALLAPASPAQEIKKLVTQGSKETGVDILFHNPTSSPQEDIDEYKNIAVVAYPLSLIVSKLSADIQYGLGNGTLVAYLGRIMGFELLNTTITSYEVEVSYRFILGGPESRYPKFEGFYVAPVVGYKIIKAATTSGITDENLSLSVSTTGIGADLGYQFVWGNFTLNLNTGMQYNSTPSTRTVTDSQNNKIEVEIESGFGWRGFGIGVGILF